jgi:hypothetical protein
MTRTVLLNEHLSAIAELLDEEPNPQERVDLWRSACAFVIARSKANFLRTYGKRVEDA